MLCKEILEQLGLDEEKMESSLFSIVFFGVYDKADVSTRDSCLRIVRYLFVEVLDGFVDVILSCGQGRYDGMGSESVSYKRKMSQMALNVLWKGRSQFCVAQRRTVLTQEFGKFFNNFPEKKN